jgi:protein phosphatase
MRRSNNQDAHSVELARDVETWQERGHVFLVADGMGAHAAGELASKLTADSVPHLYLKYDELSAPEALRKAVFDTNAEVHRRGQANHDFHNMGTTCSVLTLLPQGAVLAHIGDSRVYRLRGSYLEQLTFDHSLVWEMRQTGKFAENSDIASALPKNVITRSLGPNKVVKADIEGPHPIEVGDTFLLCSDGLTGKVTDEELGPILASLEPKEAAGVLVNLANLRGGPDNITVIVVKVTGPEIATQAGTKPITLGADKDERKVHPVLWVLLAACLFASAGIGAMGNIPVAGLALVGGFVFLVIILLKMFSDTTSGISVGATQRFGGGPYVKVPCIAGADFVNRLFDIIKQLREAAEEKKWDVDWTRLDKFCDTATQAIQAGQHATAVREYSRGISFMMEQVRAQRPKSPRNSSIDVV